jgi:hypothetical protein
VKPTQANAQSVEETEREKLRRARGSDDVAGIHEQSGEAEAGTGHILLVLALLLLPTSNTFA